MGQASRARQRAAITIVAAVVVLALGAASIADAGPLGGLGAARSDSQVARSTPVAATAVSGDPLDGDPLDGNPLDGKPMDTPPAGDLDVPGGLDRLDITRSGRPSSQPRSDVAYDDDPATVWTPEEDGEGAWLWLDLGAEQNVREVRWLGGGAGTIEVAVSNDRQRWQEIDQIDAVPEWQGVTVRDDARYVRLTLQPDEDGNLPTIAEATVYGRDAAAVTKEQKAKKDGAGKKQRAKADKKRTDDGGKASKSGGSSGNGTKGGKRGVSSENGISAEPGETRCTGDRERCSARAGQVDVEDDCDGDGTCTIDIQADGGAAECAATGGDKAKAGNGAGKQGGDGGRCEAVANGGAVALGDINP